MQGTCRLCGKHSTLCESHIIPSFVYRWLKDSSATGYIRFGELMNKRVQDGIKMHLLCEDCEQRFGQYEKAFSENIFDPFHADKSTNFAYDHWLSKFAVSVSWRVLTYFKDDILSLYPPQHLQAADHSLEVWKQFLLGRRPDPENHEQHMLLLGSVKNHTFDEMPSNINRYIMRTVDIDAMCNSTTALVYSKMGRVMLIGFINVPAREEWIGTELYVKQGQIALSDSCLPMVFGDYIVNRAQKFHGFYDRISKRQVEKIDKDYRKDMQRASKSETWKAMAHDVNLFGDKAFSDSKKE